jgi:hypothetical protein
LLTETAAVVNWQQIATSLIVWGVCTILSGILVGSVAWGVNRKTIQVLQRDQEALRRTAESHEREFVAIRAEHFKAALLAQKELGDYAHRGELSRLTADSNQQNRDILTALAEYRETVHDEVSKVHDRITAVAKDVAALKAKEPQL